MLLKAILVQRKIRVFDPGQNRSIGFAKCINLAIQYAKLTSEEAGLLRTIDAYRDAEQHWIIVVTEDALFLHARGYITLFDDLLKRALGDTLADHLPTRVLPISTQPPVGFDIMVDREFAQIRELLRPGKRRRTEARGRIRALLAMGGHLAEDVDTGEAEIDRAERAIRDDKEREKVFPRLTTVATRIVGEGPTITVHFARKEGQGAPVRIIGADDPGEAAVVREVDLQKRFPYSATTLAKALGITRPQSFKLRRELAIDTDSKCMHVFVFGRSKHPGFSDLALRRMRDALTVRTRQNTLDNHVDATAVLPFTSENETSRRI